MKTLLFIVLFPSLIGLFLPLSKLRPRRNQNVERHFYNRFDPWGYSYCRSRYKALVIRYYENRLEPIISYVAAVVNCWPILNGFRFSHAQLLLTPALSPVPALAASTSIPVRSLFSHRMCRAPRLNFFTLAVCLWDDLKLGGVASRRS
jgi:hypothetical protein